MNTLLGARSTYSFLNSLLNIQTLVSTSKQRGYQAVVLCDVGVLYGANHFYRECLNQAIKPIYGLEVHVLDSVYCVIAKNNDGFKELMQLSHLISIEPLTFEQLVQHTKDCVVILSTERSKIEQDLLQENHDKALNELFELQKYFRDFRIGFSLMASPLFHQKNKIFINICQQNNLKTVALELAYYEDEEDQQMLKITQAIDQKVEISDSRLIAQPYHSILSVQQREQQYDSLTIKNTNQLALECQVDLSEFNTRLVQYHNEYDVNSEVFLAELAKTGLKKRLETNQLPQSYQQRLDYELDVILSMGYHDYFLIVYDFILYAKKKGILVGPGRGSAAASLVAYSIGITDIDPLEYDLIFERFLNPERISMPDIDVDFEDNRRDEVIDYVVNKYGQDHVAHIITFSTLSQRQVIRDVGKVLGCHTKTIDAMSKALSQSPTATLQQSLKESKTLRELINTKPDAKRVFEVALKLEGLPRQRSLHAAGIVLSQKPLRDVIPTVTLSNGMACTQYTMEQLSDLGLVKMDFLGLKNLSIISDIKQEIQQSDPSFDLNTIPLNDQKTYRLIASGYTLGLFQLESDGMKALIKQMNPTKFLDIVDAIALYRPGPMQNRAQYIQNAKNPQLIQTIHPSVDPILKSTHGILIYQEQVIQIAREFAGFSYAKADILRKAISSKDMAVMESMKEAFLLAQPTQIAHELWTLMERFAQYGFNKAHSVSYAKISYQMAYLKANYPLLFYKALLNSVIGSTSKLKAYINECKSRNIKLLPPSMNYSYATFKLQEGGIRFGLSMIRSIGVHSAKQIEEVRYSNGLFKSYIDCVARLNKIKINQTQIENLIYAGAFDEFNLSRATMIHNLPEVLNYAEIIKVELDQQIILEPDLIGEPTIYKIRENKVVLSRQEQEVLGFHLSTHPVMSVKETHPALPNHLSQAINTSGYFSFYASIVEFKEIMTKKREPMAFLVLEDELNSIEAVLFPREFPKYKEILSTSSVYLVSGQGQSSADENKRSFIIKHLERVT